MAQEPQRRVRGQVAEVVKEKVPIGFEDTCAIGGLD